MQEKAGFVKWKLEEKVLHTLVFFLVGDSDLFRDKLHTLIYSWEPPQLCLRPCLWYRDFDHSTDSLVHCWLYYQCWLNVLSPASCVCFTVSISCFAAAEEKARMEEQSVGLGDRLFSCVPQLQSVSQLPPVGATEDILSPVLLNATLRRAKYTKSRWEGPYFV